MDQAQRWNRFYERRYLSYLKALDVMKKRNPQDSTLRNVRAAHKRLDKLEAEAKAYRSFLKAFTKLFKGYAYGRFR